MDKKNLFFRNIEKKLLTLFKILFLFSSFLFILFVSGCENITVVIGDATNGGFGNDIDKDIETQTDEVLTKYNLEENISSDLTPIFCPSTRCLDVHIKLFEMAEKEIKCAFFEFDEHNLSVKLDEIANNGINVELIVDDRYLEKEPLLELKKNPYIEIFSDEPRTKLMHNKFCVIDKKILLTGSTNPTDNGFNKNNNNFVIIDSQYLAKNYLGEFLEMKNGKFGGEDKGKNTLLYNNLTLNSEVSNESYFVKNFFCPENNCEDEIVKELKKAKKTIVFASFVLTSNPIEELLLEKDSQGIEIVGLIENRMKNIKGSIITELNESFPIYIDVNPATMHHKVFVIDEEVVVFGSMNPSSSGNKYNDENILIVKNKKFAKAYTDEIQSLMIHD